MATSVLKSLSTTIVGAAVITLGTLVTAPAYATTFTSSQTSTQASNTSISWVISAVSENAAFDTPVESQSGTPEFNSIAVLSAPAPDLFTYPVASDLSVGDLLGTFLLDYLDTLLLTYDNGLTGRMNYVYRADADHNSSEDPVQPVPEPASVLGMLTFGAFGAGWMLKRKQQQKISG